MADNKQPNRQSPTLALSKDSQPILTRHLCNTKMKVFKTSYLWTVNNFSLCYEESGECFESSVFSCGDRDEYKWSLVLYPRGDDDESKDAVSLFLNLVSSPTEETKTKFKFCFLSSKMEEACKGGTHGKVFIFSKSQYCYGFSDFASRTFIFDKSTNILIDDRLTIHCEVTVLGERTNSVGQLKPADSTLSEDFRKMLSDHMFSDVVLTCGGNTYPAHKNILAARSRVFRAMFEHNLVESKESRADVPDLDADVLEEMLHFIYTGQAPRLQDMADALLVAADKYELEQLKNMCEEALCMGLMVENVCHVLILADLHSAKTLVQQSISFIKSHASQVMATSGWHNLVSAQKTHLVAEVCLALAKDVSSSSEPPKKKSKKSS